VAMVGDFDSAETIARSITYTSNQEDSLSELVAVMAVMGDFDRAEAIARSMTPSDGTKGLNMVLCGQTMARSIIKSSRLMAALASAPTAAATKGDLDGTRELANHAERIVLALPDHLQATLMFTLAIVVAAAGDFERAEMLAWLITKPRD